MTPVPLGGEKVTPIHAKLCLMRSLALSLPVETVNLEGGPLITSEVKTQGLRGGTWPGPALQQVSSRA